MSADHLFWIDNSTLAVATYGRGMWKTLIASSAPSVVPQTGWWWNPNEGGRGFTIEQRGSNLFMATYLYEISGRTTWFGVGPAAISGGTFTGPLTSYAFGQTLTGAYKTRSIVGSGGNITVSFSSATQGTISWPGGIIPIQRYNFGPGGAGAAQHVGTPEAGWWWAPSEGGRGYSIEVHPDGRQVAIQRYRF